MLLLLRAQLFMELRKTELVDTVRQWLVDHLSAHNHALAAPASASVAAESTAIEIMDESSSLISAAS